MTAILTPALYTHSSATYTSRGLAEMDQEMLLAKCGVLTEVVADGRYWKLEFLEARNDMA